MKFFYFQRFVISLSNFPFTPRTKFSYLLFHQQTSNNSLDKPLGRVFEIVFVYEEMIGWRIYLCKFYNLLQIGLFEQQLYLKLHSILNLHLDIYSGSCPVFDNHQDHSISVFMVLSLLCIVLLGILFEVFRLLDFC